MKKCNSCGSLFPDEGRFCPECGGADAVILPDNAAPAAPEAPAVPAQPQAPVQDAYQPPQGNYIPPQSAPAGQYAPPQGEYAPPQGAYQPPQGEYAPPQGAYQPGAQAAYAAPPAQPKKKHTGCLIAAIIAGVLLVILAVILVLIGKTVKKGMEDLSNADPNELVSELFGDIFTEEDETPAAPYTKGTLENNVYTNEWAGLTFELPENLTDGTDADYEKYTDDYTDACLVTDDESEEGQVLLLVEDVARVDEDYAADDYLDIITENWLEEGDEEDGWAKSDPYTQAVAGKDYRLVKLSNEELDFVQLAACRNLDGKMICLLVWGTEDSVEEFLDSVTAP